jgi:diaminohydroxyphosphoribosylaminopyrimidine deaminase/5-amino-6-(5-phosphoribosylamino)uracil reductase
MALTASDEQALNLAVEIARNGVGAVEPNPPVGAVLYAGDQTLACGFHGAYGGAHAERDVLSRVESVPPAASLAVTLEPCSSSGKQPPCVDLILERGVRRVVVGEVDPDPRHEGRGVQLLRAQGVEVEVAPAGLVPAELLDEFRRCLSRRRPYVILKWAMGLDGCWGPRHGKDTRVSGEAARSEVHRLRAAVDGILVGSGTVVRDDPLLTARPPGPLVLRRIVLDARGRVPRDCRLFQTTDQGPVLWITGKGRKPPEGVEVQKVRDCRDLEGEVLPRLLDLGVRRLLVEGGPSVAVSFLKKGLVDRAWVFVAPVLFGGEQARGPTLAAALEELPDSLRPRVEDVRRIGCDAWFKLSWS